MTATNEATNRPVEAARQWLVENFGGDHPHPHYSEATELLSVLYAALNIDPAARVLYDRSERGIEEWDELPESGRENCIEAVRVILAAAFGSP